MKKVLTLAWTLLSKSCAKLIDFLKEIILSNDFLAQHRQSPKNFTRKRKLPFHHLIFFLMNFIKRSYQDELDGFFQALKGFEVSKRIVSKVALSKARMKLKYEAFVELTRYLIDFVYSNMIKLKSGTADVLRQYGILRLCFFIHRAIQQLKPQTPK